MRGGLNLVYDRLSALGRIRKPLFAHFAKLLALDFCMKIDLYALSHVGKVRRNNEDNFLLLSLNDGKGCTCNDGAKSPPTFHTLDASGHGLVAVVSDGMGGALAGDVASKMTVDIVRDVMLGDDDSIAGSAFNHSLPLGDLLSAATIKANEKIYAKGQSEATHQGMGATFTGAAVRKDRVDLVQVGDSRAYLFREDKFKQVTKDQSLVQQLIDVGQITPQDAETHPFRNVILQALGAQSELSPVSGYIRVYRNDLLLLCSDGLSGKLHPEDMQDILKETKNNLSLACEKLIALANQRGGEDNITVVLAHFVDESLPLPEGAPIEVNQSPRNGPDEPTLNELTETEMPHA